MSEALRLGDHCSKIGSGATPRGGKETYSADGPVALIRSQNVLNEGFSHSGLARISLEQADDLKNVAVLPGDVLLNITGDSVARVCQVDPGVLPARVNQHVAIIRPYPDSIDPSFLRYYLAAPQMQFRMHAYAAAGATRNALTKSMIEDFEIPPVPIDRQRAIASTLRALDDKIESNRRVTATLDRIIRSVFTEWFVECGQTRGCRRREVAPIHASASDQRVSPECKASPVGLVPMDWNVEPLGAHIVADRGVSYSGVGLRGDGTGVPMHNLNSIYEGGGYKHDGLKYYTGEYKDRHLVRPGEMIVANTEQGFDHLLIGYAAVVPERYGDATLFSHHLYRVRPRPESPLTIHYLVNLFNNVKWHAVIAGFSNGTTVNMLPPDALQMPLVVVPPTPIIERFSALAEAAYKTSQANYDECETLASLRELLLPKLISGEIDIKDAEHMAKAAS